VNNAVAITFSGCATTTASPLHSGTTGTSYSPTVQETTSGCGAGTPAWTVVGGTLPPGLALSSLGVVSGTPTQAGTFNFTVHVSGLARTPSDSPQQITINAPAVCAITSVSPFTSGNQNVAGYSFTISTINCTAPNAWSITAGALPTGLNLGASTGTISGTPSAAGTFTFTPQVTDNLGNSAGLPNAQIMIAPPPPAAGGSTVNATANGTLH
jgi:large repetitive protein